MISKSYATIVILCRTEQVLVSSLVLLSLIDFLATF
jgi:hypothetical protein